jgi:hypothetical protein
MGCVPLKDLFIEVVKVGFITYCEEYYIEKRMVCVVYVMP